MAAGKRLRSLWEPSGFTLLPATEAPYWGVGCHHRLFRKYVKEPSALAFGPSRLILFPAGTMASADFSLVRKGLTTLPVHSHPTNLGGRASIGPPRRPPWIRTTAFPLPPPHLPDDPLVVAGFAVACRLTRAASPSMRFVFLGAEVCLRLPFDPASRRRRCLRLGVGTTSSSRGLSPPSCRPCQAYNAGGRLVAETASRSSVSAATPKAPSEGVSRVSND